MITGSVLTPLSNFVAAPRPQLTAPALLYRPLDAAYRCDAPTGERTCSRPCVLSTGYWPASVAISVLSAGPRAPGRAIRAIIEAVTRNSRPCRRPHVVTARQSNDSRKSKLVFAYERSERPPRWAPTGCRAAAQASAYRCLLARNAARARRNSPGRSSCRTPGLPTSSSNAGTPPSTSR